MKTISLDWLSLPSIVQDENSYEESGQRATEMPHESCRIFAVRKESNVDRQANVMDSEKDDEHKPDYSCQRFVDDFLYLDSTVLFPIESQGRQVCRDQGIAATGSSGNVGPGIAQACPQTSSQDSWHVDCHHSQWTKPTFLLHFQEDSHNDLHDHIEYKVTDADVDKHVGDESPGFPSAMGVVNEHGTVGHRSVPVDFDVVLGWEVDGVVSKESSLQQGHNNHEQSRGKAGELLSIGERRHDGLEGRGLLCVHPVGFHGLQEVPVVDDAVAIVVRSAYDLLDFVPA